VYSGTDSGGVLLATYSGSALPPELTIDNPVAFITWTTDAATVSTGWTVRYSTTGLMAADQLGGVLSASSHCFAVGANRRNNNAGGVNVYCKLAATGTYVLVKLLGASDAAPNSTFGHALALEGDTLVVGAVQHQVTRGSIYVFERNSGGSDSWAQVRQVLGPVSVGNFGSAVALHDGCVLVGAPTEANNTGAVYVLCRDHGGSDNWGIVVRLSTGIASAQYSFGATVAISASFAAVADLTNSMGAAVFVYSRSSNWSLVTVLRPTGSMTLDQQWNPIVVFAGSCLLAAGYWTGQAGSALQYCLVDGVWVHLSTLQPSSITTETIITPAVTSDLALVMLGMPTRSSSTGGVFFAQSTKIV
jgi:hypothetical protein